MLLLSNIDEVSTRFAGYVEEVRDFLVQHGLAVDVPEALGELCARLSADEAFCRDVSGMVRAVSVQEAGAASSMDLLGILVVASAGADTVVRGGTQEAAVRELLRFVMQARGGARGISGGRVQAGPPQAERTLRVETAAVPPEPRRVRSEDVVSRPAALMAQPLRERSGREREVEPEFRAEPAVYETPDSAPWWRSRAVAVVAAAGIALGIGGFWMSRGHSTPSKDAAATTVSPGAGRAAGAPERPGVGEGGVTRVIVRARRAAGGRRMTAKRAAHGGVAAPQPLAVAPETKAAPSGGAMNEARTSVPAAEAKAAPVVRSPAAASVALPGAGKPAAGRAPSPGTAGSAGVASVQPIDPYAPRPLLRRGVGGQPDEAALEPEERRTPEGGVVRPQSMGMMASNVIYSPPPLYPPAASASGVQGEVTVRATVDPDGRVSDARVVSGPAPLRDAALEAVQHWRYRPYTQNGKQVAVETTAVVDFQLPE